MVSTLAGSDTPCVLIVEDAPEVAKIIAIAFRRTELSFHHCESAAKALGYLRDHRPDAIILDIAMPGMSGWQLLERLERENTLDGVPVIVLTAYATAFNRQQSRLHQVAAFLEKPIDLERLRVAIDDAVYIKRRRRQH